MSRLLASDHLGAGIERYYLTPSAGITYTIDIEPTLSSSSKLTTDDFNVAFTLTVGGGTQTSVAVTIYADDVNFTSNPTDLTAELAAANPGWSVTTAYDSGSLWVFELSIASLAVGTYTVNLPIAPNPDGVGQYGAGGPYIISAATTSVQASSGLSANHSLTITAPAVTCFDIQKTGGTDLVYDGSSYTTQTFAGTCSVEWTLDDSNVNFIIGLSADAGGVGVNTVDIAGASQGDYKFYKVTNGAVTYPYLSGIAIGSKMRVTRTMPGGATTLDVDTGSGWVNVGSGPANTGTLHVEAWFRGSLDWVGDLKVKSAGVDQAVTWTSSNNTVSTCGTVGGGGGAPAWTIDATSGHAFPADLTEHAAFEANYSTGMGAPDLIWNCQETSGTVADATGNGRTGTVTSGTYNQTVSGFSRKSINFAAAGGGIGTTNVPNANANSICAIVVAEIQSVTVASQSVVFYGTTNIWQTRFTTTPRMQHRAGGGSGTGTADPRGAVRPFPLRASRTLSENASYSDQEKVAATYSSAPTGAGFNVGNGPSPQMRVLYVIAWFSSKTEAQLKSWLQSAGWTIPW